MAALRLGVFFSTCVRVLKERTVLLRVLGLNPAPRKDSNDRGKYKMRHVCISFSIVTT